MNRLLRLKLRTWLLLASIALAHPAHAQQELPLYPGEIPGSIDAPDEEAVRDPQEAVPFRQNISRPTLTAYLPQRPDAKSAAVIILPGGSYRGVSIVKEGHDVARAFNAMGIAAFVLKYRTPNSKHMTDQTLGPLQDAQQAIHVVRARAGEWHIDPHRVGMMGFSAGGHLAATAATHAPVQDGTAPADVRPDFLMLIYPVISFSDELANRRSREMLLGATPSAEMIRLYSNELAVTAATPPTFLVHAADDTTVAVGNSIRFFEALNAHKVPVELIVFPAGGHGFGLINPTTTDRWIERCGHWLISQGLASQAAISAER
jgi:acetyl esterase/lipase